MMRARRDPTGLKSLADFLGMALNMGEEGVNCEGELGTKGVLSHVGEVQLTEYGLLRVGISRIYINKAGSLPVGRKASNLPHFLQVLHDTLTGAKLSLDIDKRLLNRGDRDPSDTKHTPVIYLVLAVSPPLSCGLEVCWINVELGGNGRITNGIVHHGLCNSFSVFAGDNIKLPIEASVSDGNHFLGVMGRRKNHGGPICETFNDAINVVLVEGNKRRTLSSSGCVGCSILHVGSDGSIITCNRSLVRKGGGNLIGRRIWKGSHGRFVLLLLCAGQNHGVPRIHVDLRLGQCVGRQVRDRCNNGHLGRGTLNTGASAGCLRGILIRHEGLVVVPPGPRNSIGTVERV
mmetsp:Transcript_1669/g.3060  ORF Transcript_1669/g.3060 Transcript_1669/m.3060 type:complete len:347 (+) Transcript_1669:11714-12754(+)